MEHKYKVQRLVVILFSLHKVEVREKGGREGTATHHMRDDQMPDLECYFRHEKVG